MDDAGHHCPGGTLIGCTAQDCGGAEDTLGQVQGTAREEGGLRNCIWGIFRERLCCPIALGSHCTLRNQSGFSTIPFTDISFLR